jgi:hypothetical protein
VPVVGLFRCASDRVGIRDVKQDGFDRQPFGGEFGATVL